MIEGKLGEHEGIEGGVQVLVKEAACLKTKLILRDTRGILLEAAPLIKPWKGYEVDENELRYLRQELSAAQE